MKDKLIIFDTTLRDGNQAPGFGMNVEQKVKVAKALEELGVDIIEAGFPVSSPADYRSVYEISKVVDDSVVCGLARCHPKDIVAAGSALDPAIKRGNGKIHVFVATSPIHREKKLDKDKKEIINMAVNGVKLARNYTDKVEFSCEDFARTELDYTVEVVRAAIDAGAETINLPDTVGYRFPTEIFDMVRYVIENVDRDGIIYSVHAHNDLGQAVSNSLYALKAGARQVECTMNGIGERAGNSALEEIVASVIERPDFFENIVCRINSQLIVPTSKLVSRMYGNDPQYNKAIVGRNAFWHSSGIHQDGVGKDKTTYEWIDPVRYGGNSQMPLTSQSGKNRIMHVLEEKGIYYSLFEIDEIRDRLKSIADIVNLDSDGILYDDHLVMAARGETEIPIYYEIKKFVARIADFSAVDIGLKYQGNIIQLKGTGNGMIDATKDAINKLPDVKIDIVDYDSIALGEGSDALGQQVIIARNNGYRVRGIGVDSDTVRGAAKALIDAANRLKYVEENC